jgi:enterochelin esterase-like enzyme
VLAAAVLAVAVPHSSALSGRVVEDGYRSAALAGTLRFAVYLPPGYETGRARYPVVYFLHGLPASPYAYRGIGFVVEALEASGRQAIVVAPQGARDGDKDPEYLDWGPGRNWETAIARELPAYVDAHYRTIPSRGARALVGLSAGGYGAVALALHHLESFSVIESWSGYFRPTDLSGTKVLPHQPSQSVHNLVRALRADFDRRSTFFAFYVGDKDTRFRAENVTLARELSRAQVPFVFRIYQGAHEQTVWSAHAQAWLGLALDHLTPETRP